MIPNALFTGRLCAAVLLIALFAPAPARAQEEIYFSAVDNVRNVLIAHINAEQVRIDMSAWYLTDREISRALINRFKAGVPVRLIGDRGSIFEIDVYTKREFYWLASQGLPIRIRYNPRSFPEIAHWKATIFVGQGVVSFGSANYTPFELAPASSTNYKDETVLFSDDPALVAAFKTRFDRLWNDTTRESESRISGPPYFKNWDDACAAEGAPCADYRTTYPTPVPMVIDTSRLEGDAPMPAEMVWGQGPSFNNRLVSEINAEAARVDMVIYRLTVPNIAQALENKHAAGVPVRLIVEPNEYRNRKWPEFWMTAAYVDRLWAVGVPIKRRVHSGLVHMKMLVTSRYATNASSNFAANWQRDHNYFVPAASKPAIYQAMADRFDIMWNDAAGFGDFTPLRPDAPALSSPAHQATGVDAAAVRLTWNRAAFATSYDVYLGTSSGSMARVANVPAQIVQDPPATYSWTAPSALQGNTTYYWRIVSRTNATPVDPAIIANSAIRTFTTTGTPGGSTPSAPASPSPANGATGVSSSPTLTWSSLGATSYQLRFGTATPPPTVATNLTSASYAPGTLAAGTRYYWQVTAVNAAGTTTGPTWSFTTGTGSTPSPLPTPWQSRDVGNVGVAGSASHSNGQFTVRGAGADIWGSADGFHFLYQALAGDGVITARLTSLQNTHAYAKAGVMLRTSLAANSAHVVLDMVPGGGIEFMRRAASGGSTAYLGGTSGSRPQWLRLSRSGDTVSSFVSSDGTSWTAVGSTTVALGSSIYAGVVVSSHTTTTLNTAVFDQLTVSGGSGGSEPPPPPPPPPPAGDVVLYASDVAAAAVHGAWSIGADAGSPNGVALVSTDTGFAAANTPLASPAHYVDVTFNAEAGTPYRIWLRLKALNDSKYNDAVWVQFSDARANGSPVYAIGSTSGLLVNLATSGTATSLANWGWQNGAYWLSQATAVSFASSGTHTMRIQLREDGVSLDQIVLSPSRYFNSAPGGPTNDTTIVSK